MFLLLDKKGLVIFMILLGHFQARRFSYVGLKRKVKVGVCEFIHGKPWNADVWCLVDAFWHVWTSAGNFYRRLQRRSTKLEYSDGSMTVKCIVRTILSVF